MPCCAGPCTGGSSPYALGISSTLTVFPGTPAVAIPPRKRPNAPHPRRLQVTDGSPSARRARPRRRVADACLATRHVAQRNQPAVGGGFCRPARHARSRLASSSPRPRSVVAARTRSRRHAPSQSLFGRAAANRHAAGPRPVGPPPVGDRAEYLELKDELGLDYFEGRSFPGWHRHVLLTALAYTWLQYERRRAGARLPSLPVARAVITEVLTAHFFVTHPH